MKKFTTKEEGEEYIEIIRSFDIRLLNKAPRGNHINLGCGKRIIPGFVNIDKYCSPGCAITQVDLLKVPWPFRDDSVSFAYANHFWEHIPRDGSWWTISNELFRIMKDRGIIEIRGPYPRAKSLTIVGHHRLIDVDSFGPMMRKLHNGLGANAFTGKGYLESIYRDIKGQYHIRKYLKLNVPPYWGLHLGFRVHKESITKREESD